MDPRAPERTTGGDLLALTLGDRAARTGQDVRALFEAHLAYHRVRQARANLQAALVVASALPAASVVWPAAVPVPVRLLAFLAWAGLLGALLVARLSERRWYRRMVDRAGELGK